jgi:predicted house-cleaning noncanonical NTP pyrophosphatase (MazG superfamily)
MPYKFETQKLHIPRDYDRRVKLTEEQREEIRELYGTISQRKLAKMYDVSRRLIQFIGCPEKHEKNLEQRKASGGSMQYYDRDKQRRYARNHRRYKQQLNKEGKL